MITTRKATPQDILHALQGQTESHDGISCWMEVRDTEDPQWSGADDVVFSVDHCLPDNFAILEGSNGQRFKMTLEALPEESE